MAHGVPAAGPGGLRRRLPWLVAALALVVAAAMSGLWLSTRDDRDAELDARAEAVAAARRLATNLTSYDYRRIEQDVQRVAESAVGTFKKDYEVAGGEQFQQLVKDNKAVAKGEVRSAGLVQFTGDKAVVLLAVDQDVTNSNTPNGRRDRNRIQLTLRQVDGKWYIEDVSVL